MRTAIRSAVATLAAVTALLGGALHPAAAQAAISFSAPETDGVVGLGESVAYRLTGDCDGTNVAVRVGSPTRSGYFDAGFGCQGVLGIPTAKELQQIGVDPADDLDVALLAYVASGGDPIATKALVLDRVQAEFLKAGSGTAVTEDTPTAEGGQSLAVSGVGTTVSLGVVDLSGVSSLSMTYATPPNPARVCLLERCRSGAVTIAAGSPDGPVVASLDLERTSGWGDFTRGVFGVRNNQGDPQELFAVFAGVLPPQCAGVGVPDNPVLVVHCGADDRLVNVDSIDFNGTGASQPYAFPADDPDFVTIFDGTSLDGWEMSGDGEFVLEDGAMKSNAGAGLGLLTYTGQTFDDFVLRLEYKVAEFDDNSGIFVRYPTAGDTAVDTAITEGYELQIDDVGQTYPGSSPLSQTGGVYSFAAPRRIASNTAGQWNTYEIRATGQVYTVTINGDEVTRFIGNRSVAGHIGVQAHDPSGTVWFRNIRVLPLED